MEKIKVGVSEPTVPEAKKLTKDDVWGKVGTPSLYSIPAGRKDDGMIVARHNDNCPYFHDKVPYKSVTIVCKPEQVEEVIYWLEYVQGGDCISRRTVVQNYVILRADYQCW